MVASDTSPGDVIGQDFGPYKIIRRLGMGGMAETFEAIRQGPSGFSRRVCLKLVRPALREDEASIHLFEREARLAAKLHHSNIVSVIDFGEIEGTLYMALELVDGVDLQTLLSARRKLSFEYAAMLGHDLALALENAHNPTGETNDEGEAEAGILHRDVSPSNVLVSRNGEVKLTDFGLANVASDGTPLSAVKGKFPYMAPERLRDEAIDGRSDLFSLGVILFETLAGRRPYDGGHDPATIMLIIEGDHPSLCELAPDTPDGLCAIIESLIERDREGRPRNASALVEQLEEFVPPPGARRKLGKMVATTPGYTPGSVPLGDGFTPASGTPHSGAQQSGRWSRRDVGKMAGWLLLATGGAAGAFAFWPRTEGGTQDAEAGSGHTTANRPDDAGDPATVAAKPVEETPAASVDSSDAGSEDASVEAAPPVIKQPAPARLTVLVSPWGRVWINGKPRGSAPLKDATLKPGRYKVSAGQGSPLETRTIRLRAGQRKTVRFDLTD
ncbi:MAG: serine/threonine protein kinase [Deltaproteobacteria bacterium]|nr:serine/threonine protein kinase [Deltaproteobacteria bacterium]